MRKKVEMSKFFDDYLCLERIFHTFWGLEGVEAGDVLADDVNFSRNLLNYNSSIFSHI